MAKKKSTGSTIKRNIKASPNQRYYLIQGDDGLPVKYQDIAKGQNKKTNEKRRFSMAVQRDYAKSLYPRTPPFSPISRLKYGDLLSELIQNQLNEKVAEAATGSIVSVGNVSSVETLKPLSEQQLIEKFGTNQITSNFERPYDDIDYTTFHDSVRSEGMTRNVVIKKAQYTVGEFTDIEFVPNYQIDDEEERNEMQEKLKENKLLNSFKQELKKIDQDVDFFLALHAILIHQATFGQSIIGVEKNSDKIPICLKILSGMRVGRLFKDKKNWNKLYGVEYLDYSASNLENILEGENILYIPNLDFSIAPNTSGYGLSDLETIRHIAEANIILNQMDIKEANAKYHTPRLFLSVSNAETPQDIIDLSIALEQSQSTVSDLDGEPHVIDNTTKVLELAEERDMNDAAICRYGDVPQGLAGLQASQVKLETSQTLYAWTQSSLMKARETLRVYIEKQWYMRNFKAVIERRLRRLGILVTDPDDPKGKREIISRDALKKNKEQTTAEEFNPQERLSENGFKIDKDGAEVIPKLEDFESIEDFIPFLDKLEKLPLTIKMTYEPITIDGLLEKAATVTSLKNSRIINNMYAWKLLKFKDLIAHPPKDLEDIPVPGGELMMQQNAFGNKNQQGKPAFSNMNIERLVTSRTKKPKPKMNVST